jgi:hypothetical protein
MRTTVPLFKKTLYLKQEWNILTNIYCGMFGKRAAYKKAGGKKATRVITNKIHRDFVKEVRQFGDTFKCPICEVERPWDHRYTYPHCKPGCKSSTFCMECALLSDQDTGLGLGEEHTCYCPGYCKTRSKVHRVDGQVLREAQGFATDVVFSVALTLRSRTPPIFWNGLNDTSD